MTCRRWVESKTSNEQNEIRQAINQYATDVHRFVEHASNYRPDTGFRKRTRKRKRRNSKRR